MSGPRSDPDAFERLLAMRVAGARRLAVVGVGDEGKPRDSLGMAAARAVDELKLEGVTVFLAGVTPESYTGPVRRSKPDRILVLDAADWRAEPGSVAVLAPASIRSTSVSTHTLPLSVVVEYFETVAKIATLVVGLQPDLESAAQRLTPPERKAVRRVAAGLSRALAPTHGPDAGAPAGRRPRPAARRPRRG